MSFSTEVKQQLVALSEKRLSNGPTGECLWAETCGLLLYSQLTAGKKCCRTGSGEIARHIAEMPAMLLGIITETDEQNDGRYTVRIPSADSRAAALEKLRTFAGAAQDAELDVLGAAIVRRLSADDECRRAVLRGAFLASGTIAEPDKSYNMEFCAEGEQSASALADVLADYGIKCGVTERRGKYVVYIHDSDDIEDALTALGATGAYFKLVDIKLEKEMRNKANRRRNCDDANISKTVGAAGQQLEAIKKLERTIGLTALPPELREIAELRVENPHLSLRELGEMLTEPLSRSGVNHRLQRLIEMAKEETK